MTLDQIGYLQKAIVIIGLVNARSDILPIETIKFVLKKKIF